MAHIAPVKGGYRAQVYVKGQRDSQRFGTKREAVTWAARREEELQSPAAGRQTLHQAFRKFADEVAPKRRGERWEIIRLVALARQIPDKRIGDVTAADLARYRDKRLQEVSPGAVLRDLGLLSAVFEAARADWGWITVNPVRAIRKPPQPRHRDRLLTRPEIRAILRQLGHGPRPATVSQAAALAFCVALRTGMRAGEICGLTWDDVRGDHLVLPLTKNGKGRNVPLSAKARRLLERARGMGMDPVLGLSSQTLDALFRRARARAGLSGFVFHDSRHWAATHIARKLNLLELCRMFGWSDPKQAMVYYSESASAIAGRL